MIPDALSEIADRLIRISPDELASIMGRNAVIDATRVATANLDAAAVLVRRAVEVLRAAGVKEDADPNLSPVAWEAMRLLQNAVAAELHTTDYFGS